MAISISPDQRRLRLATLQALQAAANLVHVTKNIDDLDTLVLITSMTQCDTRIKPDANYVEVVLGIFASATEQDVSPFRREVNCG